MINELIKATAILNAGGLVAFPTETVYGLGADARNEAAVRRVFTAKKRPYDHPLIVHIAKAEEMSLWAAAIPDAAKQLAKAFWPGPLTLVLTKQDHVLDVVTGAQATVALRVPNHPVALELLTAFGSGLVAPSANQFTHISPTTAAAVNEELGTVIEMILDGGACEVGVESTIVDVSGDEPIILRPGMITAAEIAAVIGKPVQTKRQDSPTVRAPGMHHVHYAPLTKTVVMSRAAITDYLSALPATARPVAIILCGTAMAVPVGCKMQVLSSEAAAYAHAIYHTLRSLDHEGYQQIIVEAVPPACQWDAIRDRLNKASGDRK